LRRFLKFQLIKKGIAYINHALYQTKIKTEMCDKNLRNIICIKLLIIKTYTFREDFLFKVSEKTKKRIAHGSHVFARSRQNLGIFADDLTNIIPVMFSHNWQIIKMCNI
jgi:hypothetical protein